MLLDVTCAVTLSNGVRVLNATPHPILFADNGRDVVVQPSGATLRAEMVETVVDCRGPVRFVTTVYDQSPEGLAELSVIEHEVPGVLVIGSMVSYQAYPGRVVGLVPVAGEERLPPAQRHYSTTRFAVK